ncbi:MAG: phage tail protein [Candidatus Methanoperedens sp.]|nr:phage tail protein [Candidatus Methanoperedens sp.]
MPVLPTYPGVYIEEIPSGVRTIMGVSTSVAGFIGTAKSGPINKAVHILNYSDYERRFGGLSEDSEMSYAVRQFFNNGGTDAWVVRVAKDASAAFKVLQNSTAEDVLKITALDEGKMGNNIEVRVDYKASNPASTFNISFNDETFLDLSMNSQDPRYVEDIINGVSQLVEVKREHDLAGIGTGTSISGEITDIADLLDNTHDQMRISVNGSLPVSVQIALPVAGADVAARLAALCSAIQAKVRAAANGNTALSSFTCAPNDDDNRIVMASGEAGESSSVRVLAGLRNDAAGRLKLGTINGGVETDAVSTIRPVECPDHGTLTSGVIVAADLTGPPALPGADNSKFYISIDGYGPDTVDIGTGAAAGATFLEHLQSIASRIQTKVREIKPANPGYASFTCTVTDALQKRLVLASGSRGAGSTVVVSGVSGDGLAEGLKLLTGATANTPANIMLQEGNEFPFTEAEAYNIYIASRLDRKGIYALESVDIFNLLCLPGVTDSGILMDADAYCKERRAFLIADAPRTTKKPSDMVKLISGTALPKTDYGAVYYPWIRIGNPLKGGKLRTCAPCGTIAGLYARTDSTRGVWKAPAGTDATLNGVQGVEYTLTDMENGTLNPLGVNCIRVFPVFGAVGWGARTLRGADQMASEYKYIPVRRVALYIEESLYRGTKWVVFEPNDEPLWSQIRLNIGAFMHSLFRQGAFQGKTPKEAYFVKCDKETTTQDDINRGIVNILVGFAPLKPAEFVIIKIQQMAGQIQT